MKILITGAPGTGKSEISKALGKALKYKVINDKIFCKKNKLGVEKTIDSSKEYVVNIKDLNQIIKLQIKENTIFDGHLWCELSKSNLKNFDYIFVLIAPVGVLKKRLKERKYTDLKIVENIFCQECEYFEDSFKNKGINFKIINVNNNLNNNLKKIMVNLKW